MCLCGCQSKQPPEPCLSGKILTTPPYDFYLLSELLLCLEDLECTSRSPYITHTTAVLFFVAPHNTDLCRLQQKMVYCCRLSSYVTSTSLSVPRSSHLRYRSCSWLDRGTRERPSACCWSRRHHGRYGRSSGLKVLLLLLLLQLREVRHLSPRVKPCLFSASLLCYAIGEAAMNKGRGRPAHQLAGITLRH